MAKTTKASGATFTENELNDPSPPEVIRRAELGRVDQLAGTDYSEPLSNESQSSDSETASLLEPAQTTENPSGQTEEEDSTADLMVGDGQMETVKPYDEWTVEELREECRARELTVSGNKADLVSRLEENDLESEEDEEVLDEI